MGTLVKTLNVRETVIIGPDVRIVIERITDCRVRTRIIAPKDHAITILDEDGQIAVRKRDDAPEPPV